ncbi:MAG: FMN-binding glutamate synthase family protein, partial [Gammaproteobacteria bacterium]|nr:FMN-binding glutamate synthase family protein [Gammaproteobacteria bacterium]
MTPAVRFFWIVSLAWLPLSYYLLMDATDWIVMPAALGEHPALLTLFLFAAVYVSIGMRDLYSSESNLRRNYPVFANLRYLFESIRPEIRQYFIASNLEEAPFNREARDLIYRRAKNVNDTLPFGTEQNLMEQG